VISARLPEKAISCGPLPAAILRRALPVAASKTVTNEAAEELTNVLGDRQDGLVAREWLVALASEALRTGDSAFTLGRLHALEEQREVEQLEAALLAWGKLDSVRW